jgi:hypothetical protein
MSQFTKEEILMADCPEIQGLCKPEWNCFALIKNGHYEDYMFFKGRKHPYTNPKFYIIWLPLEHQLWEMLEAEGKGDWVTQLMLIWNVTNALTIPRLTEKEERRILAYWAQFKTWWQVIFALVMHELYQKVWDFNKKGWVKE